MRKLLLACALLAAASAFAAPPQPPTVTLTSPANGSQFMTPLTLTLSANASDSDGTVQRVEFYRGNVLLGTDTTAPYSFVWTNVPAGTYSLTAKAIDDANKSGTSEAVQITVVAVTTVISAPTEGAVIQGRSTSVTGTFTGLPDTTSIIVTGGGHSVLASNSGNTFSAGVALTPGVNAIEVQVARRDGTGELVSRNVTAVDAPVAALTRPTTFGPYTVPATVTVEAQAASAQGTIARVDFFDNGAQFGSASAPPYVVSRDLTTAGSHTIFARAVDSFGFTGDSRSIVLTAQSQPPVVLLTSPTSGDSFRQGGTVSLAATATDPDGTVTRVDFLANGSVIGTDTTSPFAFAWTNVPAGSHTLTARATDNTGTTGTSAPVSITVTANNPPTVTLTSPTAGATYVAPATIAFAANASDTDGTISRVEFLANGGVVSTSTSAPYQFSWTGVAAGTYSLAARAVDDGNATTTSLAVLVTVNSPPPNQLPSVSITTPANGASFAAPVDIPVSATASDPDGTVTKVEFLDGTTLLATVTTPPYNFNWVNVRPGAHALNARATDDRGATRTATANITVTGSSAEISAPPEGAQFSAPASYTITTFVSTSSGTIMGVEFFDGATLIGTASFNAPSATINFPYANVPAGTHVHTVRATHSSGATVTSPPRTVVVIAPPSVTLSAPSADSFYIAPAIVKLTAVPDHFANPVSQVEFLANGTSVGIVTSAPYEFTWSNAGAGSYTLTARATDSGGATATSPGVPVTVAASPVLTVAPGLDGSTVPYSTITIRGNVRTEPNSSVTVNGVSAEIAPDGEFVLNNVPLAPGANSLAISASTIDGATASRTITVNRAGSSVVTLSAGTYHGLAPLRVEFKIAITGVAVKKVEMDFFGAGTFQDVTSFGGTFVLTYPTAGMFAPRARVTDVNDVLYLSNPIGVFARSAADMDQLMRGVLTGMLERLRIADNARALNRVTASAFQQFEGVFAAIVQAGDHVNVIAEFGSPRETSIGLTLCEIFVTRDVGASQEGFWIYLVRGQDGIWRIDAM